MTVDPTTHEEWTSAVALVAVVLGRLEDALPVLARIAADVERDWPAEQGRLWGERAALVRRTLVNELDAVLGAARLIEAAMQDGPVHEPEGNGLPIVPSAVGRRAGGPRLGGTDAQRVDDARGVRIAQLGEA